MIQKFMYLFFTPIFYTNTLYQYFWYTNTILYTNTFNSDVIILIATIFELILYETGTGTLCTDALFNSLRIKFPR